MDIDTHLAPLGSNAERSRQHNRRLVLGAVRALQPVGRAEIARRSGLSTQTVSTIVAELEGSGLLAPAGLVRRGRGLPSRQYCLNGNGAAALGVEVRPDALVAALVNLAGLPLAELREPIEEAAPARVAAQVDGMLARLLADAPVTRAQILGAGVVRPGPFGETGIAGRGRTALQGWGGPDIATVFEDRLSLPVTLAHDATAAALGESVCGRAAGLRSFCFVYFGAGLGLGVMVDGRMLRGAFGNAGELGHVVVEPGGLPCACGNRGCLEVYASRTALRDRLARAGIAVATSTDVERLHMAGSAHLARWLTAAAPPLARAVGMLENLFDPEAVILGGAMPDGVLDALINRMALPGGSVADRARRALPRVMRGGAGRMTAARGGAALVIHDTLTPRFAPLGLGDETCP